MAPSPPELPQDPEESAREALARARRHARNTVAEALETLRALLDAASLAATGVPAQQHPLFAGTARRIRGWSRALAAEGRLEGDLGAALADALEQEIARWEARARDDADARAVLRAFLGLRELLWELGVRRTTGGDAPDEGRSEPETSSGRGPRAAERGRAGGDAGPSEDESASDRRETRPVRRARRVPVQG